MKLDILAFGAHPDDVELSCSGTLLKHIQMDKKAGIVDLTEGELGTRGSRELRIEESLNAAKILGVHVRENLKMDDGFFRNNKEHQLKIIQVIRKYQPEIVLANAVHDRHPDHGRASQLISEACFLSGLRKIETSVDGKTQNAWRPKAVYHYIQHNNLQPSFVVDISNFMETKMKSIKAYQSQFYNPESNEPNTILTSPEYLEHIYQRAADMGRIVGVRYAEGYVAERYIGVNNLFDLM